MDTETERLIQQALERLMENRTTFVIAHRPHSGGVALLKHRLIAVIPPG